MAAGGEELDIVCEACLNETASPQLLRDHCFKPFLHQSTRRVFAVFSQQLQRLVPIRPLPQRRLKPGKRFIICADVSTPAGCPRGEDCSFAHNRHEQEHWNRQLTQQATLPINPRPVPIRPAQQFLYDASQFPSLSPSRPVFRQLPPPRPSYQPQQYYTRHDFPRLPPSLPASYPEGMPGAAHRGSNRSSSESGPMGRPQYRTRQSSLPAQHFPNIPTAPHISTSGTTPQATPTVDVHDKLSQSNYKQKFSSLLSLEQDEHKRVLIDKCDGEYSLVLSPTGSRPPAVHKYSNKWVSYRCYGYLDGISGDQVAYATQASQGSININNSQGAMVCRADILRDNYNHIEERLYIAFDESEYRKLRHEFQGSGFKVAVHFILKHSYFKNLKNCVEKLSQAMIDKIVPTPKSFRIPLRELEINLDHYRKYCSSDQLEALEAVLTISPAGPPNIIVGPFGTGKTRILAIAASCFFHQSRLPDHPPARILVCTQQRESVDNFYDHYKNLLLHETDVEVVILRDYGFKHIKTEEENVYRTIPEFVSLIKSPGVSPRLLVMSTCMMVRELVRDVGNEFFTHILIDEGAQMREPEAIAPLSLAHPGTTKIVIAGDQHQVGPEMLVLGELPLSCGLGVSLLERLYSAYKLHRQEDYISTLVTNYRSHPKIFELPSALFYETPLIAPSDRAPPSLHPKYPYPLVFLCSSVDQQVSLVRDNINRREAEVLLEEAGKMAEGWWESSWGRLDLEQTCVMSPSRPQLTLVSRLIFKKFHQRLKEMRRLPTYDMQGRQFRALFLSTSEPTNENGSTKNPTKSLVDRHIFNTAITRAISLVVAAGNPFLLLKTEQSMVARYGKRALVWNNYLHRCLDNQSFIIPDSLAVKNKPAVIESLRAALAGSLWPSEALPAEDDFPPLVAQKPQTTPTKPLGQATPTRPLVQVTPTKPLGQATPTKPRGRAASESVASGREGQPAARHRISVPQLPSSSYDISNPIYSQLGGTFSQLPGQPPAAQWPSFDDDDLKKFFPALYDSNHGNGLPGAESPADNVFSPIVPAQQIPTHSSDTGQADQTSVSTEWAGGEMRVSPSIGSSVSEEPNNTSKPVPLIPTSSDDTHRRTPTPPTATPTEPIPRRLSRLESDYDIRDQIGKGGFGVVFDVWKKDEQFPYALKIIRLSDEQKQQELVLREVRALAKLEHQNIVRYYTSWKERAPHDWAQRLHWSSLKSSESLPSVGFRVPTAAGSSSSEGPITPVTTTASGGDVSDSVVTFRNSEGSGPVVEQQHSEELSQESTKQPLASVIRQPLASGVKQPVASVASVPMCLFIQTELCRRDTLRQWLLNNCGEKTRSKKKVFNYFKQILDGLVYIHSQSLVHRDMKPANIFFSQRDEDRIKIGDFGLVKAGIPMSHHTGSDHGPVRAADSQSGGGSRPVGTFLYMSPEVMEGRGCDQKSDMFALGIIFFELFYCMRTDNQKYQVVTDLKRDFKFPQYFVQRLPDGVSSIVKMLLCPSPGRRPTSLQLLEHNSLKRLDKKIRQSKNEHVPVF